MLFLFIIPPVYAIGNISYISQTNCYLSGCDCFSGTEDFNYCNRLNNTLGYNVKIFHENNVRDNSTGWQTNFPNTQLIFLGDISLTILNGSTNPTDSNKFFDGIFSVVNSSSTRVFTTELNNYQYNNTVTDTLTRGFFFRAGFVNFTGKNNTCWGLDTFEVIDSANCNLPAGAPIKLYTQANNFTVYQKTSSTEGWVGFTCEPGGLPSDRYPVIASSVPTGIGQNNGTFWGLNTPSLYTEKAWDLFDRAVCSVMDEPPAGSITGLFSLNKDIYKPRDTLNIAFQTSSSISSISVSITEPGEIPGIPIGNMIRQSDVWRLDNYIIADNVANGTYKITLTAKACGATPQQITKFVPIQPYSITAVTDKLSYHSGENVSITLNTLDAYNASLNLTAKIDIVNPNSTVTNVYYGIIPRSTVKTYKIPTSPVGGQYIINITFNDSDKRNFTIGRNFIVDMFGNLSITPKIWNVQVSAPGNKTQLFNITNTGQVTLNISIRTDNSNITFDKNFLSIDVGKTGNFTGRFLVSSPGNFTGNIFLNSSSGEYVIASTASFLYQPSASSSLVVSPSSISVVTIPGKNIAKTFELENLAPFEASDIIYKVSDSLKSIVTLTSVAGAVSASGTSAISIKISSSSLSVGKYDGTVQINSSVGSTYITIGLEIIGDLTKEANTKLSELETLKEEITALQNKRKDVTSLNILYDEIETKLEDVKTNYNEGNYEEAKTMMQEASTSITELQSMITDIATQKTNYGGIIWAVAIMIILIIIAIVAYKYKDQIMDKLSKKQEPSEGYSPQPQGDYRTEYY